MRPLLLPLRRAVLSRGRLVPAVAAASRLRPRCSQDLCVHSVRRQLAFLAATRPCFANHTIELPGLGDSITEGVIVQWAKQVGEAVAVDDVVAVVETDKVSVDVRSPHAGVLVKHFASVDDTLAVGAPLCLIDGEATAAAAAPAEKAAAESEASSSAPAAAEAAKPAESAPEPSPEAKRGHTPLIKFKGKRALPAEAQLTMASDAGATAAEEPEHVSYALEFDQIVGGAMYGRPPITEEEILAVESGGAEISPPGRLRSMWG